MNNISGRINRDIATYIKEYGAGGKKYNAGYGIEIDNENYIISVDTTTIASKDDLIIDIDEPTTVAVGGLPKGSIIDDTSVTEVLEDVLFPYVPFTIDTVSSVASSSTYIVGSQVLVSRVVVDINLGSEEVTSIVIKSGDIVLGRKDINIENNNTITIIPPYEITSSSESVKSLIVEVSDSETTLTKELNYSFYYPYYYGIVDHTYPYTSEEILELTSGVSAYHIPSSALQFAMNKDYTLFATTITLSTIKDQNGHDVISNFDKSQVVVNGITYNVYSLSIASGNTMSYTFT